MYGDSVYGDSVYGDSPRRRYGLHNGWRFAHGPRFPWSALGREPAGEDVDLPHSWNGHDTFQEGVVYFQGKGIYRRSFGIPEALGDPRERRWHLIAGGFYGLAEIRLNRRRAARVDGQYLGFRLDVTNRLSTSGENDLEIRMTNRCPQWVLPGTEEPDFLVHGGLSGGLFLESLPALRLLESSVELEPRGLLRGEACMVLRARAVSQGPARDGVRIRWRLQDPDGLEVGAAESREVDAWGSPQALRAYGEEGYEGALSPELSVEIPIPSPRLWSPESPNLYTAVAEVRVGEEVVDRTRLRCGLREASFSIDGFFLNGERRGLHGFNRHEAVPGLGNALPGGLHREDAQIIKAHGGNFVRLSHYPQHPDFLDACDELGLLVYAEISSWKSVRGGRWRRSALRQMRSMILRDRHRPSIILWGMGNESRHLETYRSLHGMIRRLDPGRASIYAENHLYRARRQGILGLPDVWGCNYELDLLEKGRDGARRQSVVVSEGCNDLAPRGSFEAEKEQLQSLARLWAAIDGKPYVAGYALWSYNDYATMHRDRYTRTTGKFDPWHLPKMSASLFAARHSEGPVLRLFGPWGRAAKKGVTMGSRREIFVITNCQDIEIFLGGRSLGRSLGPGSGELYRRLELEFEDADLVARGRFSGQPFSDQAVQEVLPVHGEAVAWVLHPEPLAASATPARGWMGITLEAVDAAGVRDREFSGHAHIELDGPIRSGAYTGDDKVLIASGLGRTFLRATGEPGVARLRVVSPGLETGETEIRFEQAQPDDLPREL